MDCVRDIVMEFGGTGLILQVLQEHSTHIGAVDCAFRALFPLSRCAAAAATIRHEGGISLILKAMRQHVAFNGACATIHEVGCGMLCNIACNESGRTSLVDLGGLEVVGLVLETYSAHVGIQERGCILFSNVALEDHGRAQVAGTVGVVHTIIEALIQHKTEAGVVQQICKAIYLLALRKPNIEKLTSAGAVQAILEAMLQHNTHPTIQVYGLGALCGLGRSQDGGRKVADFGGIACALAAMEHIVDPNVRAHGLGLLRILAVDPVNESEIVRANGRQLVLQAMLAHREDVRVQEQGLGAFANLSCKDNHDVLLAGTSSIAHILDTMRAHPDDVDVQEHGCQALTNLAFNDENTERIVHLGAYDVLQRIADRHVDNQQLMHHAGLAYGKLPERFAKPELAVAFREIVMLVCPTLLANPVAPTLSLMLAQTLEGLFCLQGFGGLMH